MTHNDRLRIFRGLLWGFWRSAWGRRCAFASVGLKKGLFSAFWGVGCVFGCVWRVPWLLGGFLGERGRGCTRGYFFRFLLFGVLPLPSVRKFLYGMQGIWAAIGEIVYIILNLSVSKKIL